MEGSRAVWEGLGMTVGGTLPDPHSTDTHTSCLRHPKLFTVDQSRASNAPGRCSTRGTDSSDTKDYFTTPAAPRTVIHWFCFVYIKNQTQDPGNVAVRMRG